MYAVKYYQLIKEELIAANKISKNQQVKNGLAVPQYDEK
jgi:hypothetical protein